MWAYPWGGGAAGGCEAGGRGSGDWGAGVCCCGGPAGGAAGWVGAGAPCSQGGCGETAAGAVAGLPGPVTAILRLQMAIQELAVDAAATGDRLKAVQALALDPIVGSIDTAERIVEDLLKAHRRLLPQFFPDARMRDTTP